MRDIVTSRLPFWEDDPAVGARPAAVRLRRDVLAVHRRGRPRAAAATARRPTRTPRRCCSSSTGRSRSTIDGAGHDLAPGGYAYLPPGGAWTLRNRAARSRARFHWIRKAYQRVDGLDVPEPFVTDEHDVEPMPMPDTDGAWATTRFVDPADLRHDMHVNIVTFQPGASIPFPETHVMEHGLYVLQGKAMYLLNQDWVEVEAGDFMWLRAFCPQACYAGGPAVPLPALQGRQPARAACRGGYSAVTEIVFRFPCAKLRFLYNLASARRLLWHGNHPPDGGRRAGQRGMGWTMAVAAEADGHHQRAQHARWAMSRCRRPRWTSCASTASPGARRAAPKASAAPARCSSRGPASPAPTEWIAINACLVPAAALDGQEVVTAEGLGTPDALHPVQHEMAVRGGSQCGYCTPGFVCSMAAEYYRPDRGDAGRPTRATPSTAPTASTCTR